MGMERRTGRSSGNSREKSKWKEAKRTKLESEPEQSRAGMTESEFVGETRQGDRKIQAEGFRRCR